MQRLDAMTGRKYTNAQGEERTSWLRVGVLIEKDDGKKFLKLEALPIPNEKGEVWISFFEPRESRAESKPAPKQGTTATELSDEIPFVLLVGCIAASALVTLVA